MPLKIAICGGGIGGLTTALCINRLCGDQVSLEIYEQALEYKEIGAGIGLGPNAARVLSLVGLEDAMDSITASTYNPGAQVWMRIKRWDTGAVVEDIMVPGGLKRKRRGFHRGELLQVLYATVSSNPHIRLHTNKKVSHVERLPSEEMKLSFVDGSSATAELVIAADGIHSVVRGRYLKDDAIFSGWIAYRGLVPMEKISEFWQRDQADLSGFWSGVGSHFMTYPISKDGQLLNIVAFAEGKPAQSKESWVHRTTKSEVFSRYKGWDPIVQKIIECMEDEPGCWSLYDRLPYKEWVFEQGKVVLMGDAAHSMLPHNGQGGSQSIEDAYTLAKSLQVYFESGAVELEKYLRLYESIRLPRTASVQASSRETGKIYEQVADDMIGIVDDDERLKKVAEKLQTRMHWMWGYEVETEFEKAFKALQK